MNLLIRIEAEVEINVWRIFLVVKQEGKGDVMDQKIDFPMKYTPLSDCNEEQLSSSFHSGYVANDEFQSLVKQVYNCHRCPRMEGRTRVLGSGNGPLNAKLIFIAEAPGRLGAERSGIPLTRDQTGRNFDALLKSANIDRQSVFITNAVLCNPRDEKGHNASPTSHEVSNCSDHLRATIQLLQPRYVVALGQIALQALQQIERHTITLTQNSGVPILWYNRWLIALYHPGPRARIHRSLELQMEDFRRLGAFIRSDKCN